MNLSKFLWSKPTANHPWTPNVVFYFLLPFLPTYNIHGSQSDTFKPKLCHSISMLSGFNIKSNVLYCGHQGPTQSGPCLLLWHHHLVLSPSYSSHTGLLVYAWTGQKHSNFKVFTFAISSYWNVLCQIPAWLILLLKTLNSLPLLIEWNFNSSMWHLRPFMMWSTLIPTS